MMKLAGMRKDLASFRQCLRNLLMGKYNRAHESFFICTSVAANYIVGRNSNETFLSGIKLDALAAGRKIIKLVTNRMICTSSFNKKEWPSKNFCIVNEVEE